jgi:ABC-type glutathione transport system ATPase component
MGSAGEQPPESRTTPSSKDAVHLEAHAAGHALINQAGRDLHQYYQAGVHVAQRAELGTVEDECPYPGLVSFGCGQARWFFGRERLTTKLMMNLDARLRTGGIQVLVAPSGAGKSSLLHAGLLPQVDSGALPGSSRWPKIAFTPTAQPMDALATQIAALTGLDPVSLTQELTIDSQRCVEMLRGHLGLQDKDARVVVIVDQFEELFTLCSDDQQRRVFISSLHQLATLRSETVAGARFAGLVVVGVRADFYAACAHDPMPLSII